MCRVDLGARSSWLGAPRAEACHTIDARDGASRTMRPRCCVDLIDHGIDRHEAASSRRTTPELCVSIAPRKPERRREGREPAAPMARLRRQKQAAGTTGSAGNIPTLPARWFSRLLRVLPGAPGFLVTVRDSTLIARRRGGIGFGMPGPRDLAVRRDAFVHMLLDMLCPDHAARRRRPPHPHLHVRDDRDTPSRRGGMGLHNHVF